MEDKYRYIVTSQPDKLEQELMPFMRYLLSTGKIEWVVLHDLDTNDDQRIVDDNPDSIFIFLEQLAAKDGQILDMNVEIYIGPTVYRILVVRGLDIDILCSDDSILTLPELQNFKQADISLYNAGY